MARIAFYTWAIGKGPVGSEVLSGFVAALASVFEEAQASEGFIARTVKPDPKAAPFGQDYGPWGTFAVPHFYDGGIASGEVTQASTLSLWRDIGAVRRFAYGAPLHRAALARRGQWFRRPEWPTYAMWWVADGETPTWRQACRKLEELDELGPTPSAFDFKAPFDPEGGRMRPSAV